MKEVQTSLLLLITTSALTYRCGLPLQHTTILMLLLLLLLRLYYCGNWTLHLLVTQDAVAAAAAAVACW
jgi:hypothetical protein